MYTALRRRQAPAATSGGQLEENLTMKQTRSINVLHHNLDACLIRMLIAKTRRWLRVLPRKVRLKSLRISLFQSRRGLTVSWSEKRKVGTVIPNSNQNLPNG